MSPDLLAAGRRATLALLGAPVSRLLLAFAQRSEAQLGLALVYHKTADLAGDPSRELVPAIAAHALERQVAHLQARYTLVRASELQGAAAARRAGQRFPVAITFDDDLLCHLETAAPVLQRAGAPATFFLCGASLDRPEEFWWERLQRVYDAVSRADDRCSSSHGRPLLTLHDQARAMEQMSPGEREQLLASLGALPGRTEGGLSSVLARGLSTAGFEIGFHTQEHPLLTNLHGDALVRALALGRADLRLIVDRHLDLLAYPHGQGDERVAAQASAAGFRYAFTGEPQAVAASDHPLLLGRIDPRRSSIGAFALQLVSALLERMGTDTGPPVRGRGRGRLPSSGPVKMTHGRPTDDPPMTQITRRPAPPRRTPLKGAVIGAGAIAQQHLDCVRSLPEAELVGICDLSPALAQAAAERFGVPSVFSSHRELLEQLRPDVVHVTTSPASHFEIARDALAAGAHVIVEKPITTDPHHLDELLAEAQRRERTLIEDYNYLFNTQIREMLRALHHGELGTVVHVDLAVDLETSHGARTPISLDAVRGGRVGDFMPHLAALAHAFAGSHRSCTALWPRRNDESPFDEFRALIDCERATVSASYSSHSPPDGFWVRIHGSRMRLSANLFETRMVRETVPPLPRPLVPVVNGLREAGKVGGAALGGLWRKLGDGPGAYEGLWLLLARTYRAITDGTPPPVAPQQILAVNRIARELLAGAPHITERDR